MAIIIYSEKWMNSHYKYSVFQVKMKSHNTVYYQLSKKKYKISFSILATILIIKKKNYQKIWL